MHFIVKVGHDVLAWLFLRDVNSVLQCVSGTEDVKRKLGLRPGRASMSLLRIQLWGSPGFYSQWSVDGKLSKLNTGSFHSQTSEPRKADVRAKGRAVSYTMRLVKTSCKTIDYSLVN